MKKSFIIGVAGLLSLASCTTNETAEMTYPNTRTETVQDDYFGTSVADPYRWLEIDTAAEVEAWVDAQNEVTQGFLSKIDYRSAIAERYTDLFNFVKRSAPSKVGNNFFFYKNDGLQNQSVIYVKDGQNGTPKVFIDPNEVDKNGTTSISLSGASKDERYLAVSTNVAGSDWSELTVYDLETMEQMEDKIEWVKFSGASWWKDGFFYSRYPAPDKGTELSGNNKFHSVWYHKVGTSQSEDVLIHRDDNNPDYYNFGGVTEDERFLVMYKQPGTDGFATYYMDLTEDGLNGELKLLFEGFGNKSSVVDNTDNKLLVLTDIDAPNYRLIEVDLNNTAKANWKDIIPATDNLLEGVSTGGGKLFASYLEKATNRIYQMNYDGSDKIAIELPGLGSAGGFSGKKEDSQLFYSFTSFIYPSIIFNYDIESGTSAPFFETELKFSPEDYVEKQVEYKSKDGETVTMFIVHKKGLELDGTNPTYLYGYGGFNISLTPSFSTSRIILLENNGVFAMPNLRGGGEYGEEWHKDGMLFNKQNVFDDFISAGEYLIAENYTSSEKLAIAGGSNGGLLVGACMAQRPDLFSVAFPAVGVMDMLRYHKFTVGKGWIPEYGNAENSKEEFDNLYAYSPVHNLEPNVDYPATMVTTADHDDRVVPAHSFKFAAQLQASNSGKNPTLIRIEKNAGHGAGKPVSKIIEEQSDIWSFLFYNTNSPINYK
ncbi:MAG: prolyl oligopeptidase family serine peptidase [Saprospiraceae bacterium]|nr:prolyl oligopeptidase family serine peptidase [Saprospiraceae bacterium]